MSSPEEPRTAGTGPDHSRSGDDVAEAIRVAERGSSVQEPHDRGTENTTGEAPVEQRYGDPEMTEGQVVSKVEWPLALPLVLSGLRSATLQVVATATVAAFTSGGGLGRLLTSGQSQNDYPQMFAGAILIAALAILLDLLLGGLGRLAARRARPRSKTAAALAVAPA